MKTIPTTVFVRLLASAFLWGGAAVAGKILLQELPPSLVSGWRFGVATAALFLWIVLTRRASLIIPVSEHIRLAVLGLLGVSACYFFYFTGLSRSSAFNAGVIEATIPILTAIGASAFGQERLKAINTVGIVISYFGVALIISQGDAAAILHLHFGPGDIYLLLSTIVFAAYNLLLNRLPTKLRNDVQMFYIFFYGTIGFLPWIMINDDAVHAGSYFPHTFNGIVSCAFLSIAASIFAYIWFNAGIQLIGPTRAAAFINFVPIFTIIGALFILGERPSTIQFVGSAFVLAGVFLAQLRNSSARRA